MAHASSQDISASSSVLSRRFVLTLLGTVALLAAPSAARAGAITVGWDPNPEPSVAGYVVYISTQPGAIGDSVDAGYKTVFTYSSARPDITYYFSVAAYERVSGGVVIGQRSAPLAIRAVGVSPLPPATPPPAVPTSVLTNGGFESGISGWTASGNQSVVTAGSWWGISEGSRAVAFNSGDSTPNGSVSRTFPTVVGQTYTVSFDVGALSIVNRDEQRLQVSVTGASPLLTKVLPVLAPGNGTKYTPSTLTFVANSTASTLAFRDVSVATVAVDLVLDNVRVTTIGK